MTGLTVIEPENKILTHEIRRKIAEHGMNTSDINISCAVSLDDIAGRSSDIIAVSADCANISRPLESARPRCKILLVPGGYNAGFADSQCVVTYGMSAKNTLTLSSIGETACVLALQRELLMASGNLLDRQELKINSGCLKDADNLLAVSGALLLLGIIPD